MTSTLPLLEQVLQRYGNQLYRLAMLLANDTAQAEQALIRLVRILASSPSDQPIDQHLPILLLNALPKPGKAARKPPSWAQADDPRSPQAVLLATLARLPRDQRMALLPIPIRVTPEALPTTEERAARRLALLALASTAGFPDLPGILTDQEAPELCQAARAALTLDDPALHSDPAVRGHLALCEDCRAAANRWNQLATLVDDALRTSLRPLEMPNYLLQRMLAAASPTQRPAIWRMLTGTWVRRALLPVLILGIIGAIIWPRQPEPSPTVQTGAGIPAMRGLVAAARATLYAPHERGMWVDRYQIRWNLPDGSYAPLIGEVWREPNGRARMQLSHEAGGGPYEYMLGDGRSSLWYAVTYNYADSAGLLQRWDQPLMAFHTADLALQQAAFDARLTMGAWNLPALYLRQATDKALQSWGSQRRSDGTRVEVIGFAGVSPLIGRPGGVDTAGAPITILLHIDASTGKLVEVRELIGPGGGDQVTRTTWQYLGSEEISDKNARDRAMNPRASFAGSQEFPAEPSPMVQPDLPGLPEQMAFSPVLLLDQEFPRLELPLRLPPETTHAALIADTNQQPLVVYYAGGGRFLTLHFSENDERNRADFSTEGRIEQLTIGDHPTLLRQVAAMHYSAMLQPPTATPARPLILVDAIGYDRQELLDVLASLQPFSNDTLRDQYTLFMQPGQDREASQALLAALTLPDNPQPGQARYQLATRFQRQNPFPVELNDPYHYPAYGGRPAMLFEERWTRLPAASSTGNQRDGSAEPQPTEAFFIQRAADGAVFERRYHSAGGTWAWYGPESTIIPTETYDSFRFTQEPQATLKRMLICGGQKSDESAGMIVYSMTEPLDNTPHCMHPAYTFLSQVGFRYGTRQSILNGVAGPYFADLTVAETTTRLTLSGARVVRVETRVGTDPDGVLLEAWERIDDQLVDASAFPSDLSTTPPPALLEWTFTAPISASVSLTDALQLAQSPLLAYPDPLPATAPFTATGTWSQTWVAATKPAHTTVDQSGNAFAWHDALTTGAAVQLQLNYVNETRQRTESAFLLQGSADRLIPFFRATSTWNSSNPTEVLIGDQALPGWQVFTESGIWVLFEHDGTLIAFPDSTSLREIIRSMRMVPP